MIQPQADKMKTVLFTRLSGIGKRTWIQQQHEQEGELLGQRPNGELLGETKTGMAE